MGARPQYELRYLPVFWEDMASTVIYLRDTLKNPQAAAKLIDDVEAGILEHRENPTAAAVYKTTRGREVPYHWFSVGNYLVFYVVIGDTMEVRRFVYGARDLTKIVL